MGPASSITGSKGANRIIRSLLLPFSLHLSLLLLFFSVWLRFQAGCLHMRPKVATKQPRLTLFTQLAFQR